jgi:subtilisin family serine protease
VNTAIDNTITAGVHVVVAAGNDRVDACTRSPASAALAMTVGSINSADAVSTFSNFGSCVDIFAPGEGIQSSWPTSDTAYIYRGGTSMAAPHVSGVKALFLSYNYLKPSPLDSAMLQLSTIGLIKNFPAGTVNNILYSAPPKAFHNDHRKNVDRSFDLVRGESEIGL